MERFNVLLVRLLDGARHNAYAGAANVVCAGLRRLGHAARVAENELVHDATNIVVGAHNLVPDVVHALPAGSIVFNTERVGARAPFVDALVPFARALTVWDYSRANVAAWSTLGIAAHYLEPGYLPELTTMPLDTPADLDVVFYGAITPRRAAILDVLARGGIDVTVVTDRYGADRDAVLARARLVLNLHADAEGALEMSRVVHALANRRALVTEAGPDTEIDDDLRAGLAMAAVPELPRRCRQLLDDPAARAALAARGFEALARRDFTRSLATALASRSAATRPA